MGLRSGEPRAPGGPWQRLAPMEQMGVRGVRSPWLAPSPNPCVSLLLRIPPGAQRIPGSSGPLPWAAAGLLCLLLTVGSCRGSSKVPRVGLGCQPVRLAAAGCVTV